MTEGDLEWTYADLRLRCELVANSIANHGIAKGSVVGMHLPRCADAIAVMLGIMAAGCVYLPLDPSYPSDRLRFMLDQAQAAAVISTSSEPDFYGAHRTRLPPPSQQVAASEKALDEPVQASVDTGSLGPQDCAYILFTSGSTGQPRGVMVSHENITAMNEWSAKTLGLTSLDASATTCSLSFDPSFHETLLPLSVGGTVHVISHALALGQLTRKVSFIATTPTIASELLRANQLPTLKVLMLGGEVLASDVAERILSSGCVERLLNCYGPTECSVCVTVAEIVSPVPEIIPIGRSVPGTEVLVLDGSGNLVPDGEVGEICVFGKQVTRGYTNDPKATAERFLHASDSRLGARRYYRTGDLGYRSPDGTVYFSGRADDQVKINGIRIELGEIDAVIRSHPQVFDAATVVTAESRVVAYVVPARSEDALDLVAVKGYLAKRLPRFMVPTRVMVLPELPKTVNGKLDSALLPEWRPDRPERPGRQLLMADDLDSTTRLVARIVADVTGFAGEINPSDDLIDDLGGTSLDLVRVLAEIERSGGKRVRITEALADTSVTGLATLLRDEGTRRAADFAFNANGDAAPLFMIHPYLGSMLQFRHMAQLLPASQPVYGFHAFGGDGESNVSPTIYSLARDIVTRIRSVRPTGNIVMIGHSAGGLIVLEAARILLEEEEVEPRILLMDTHRMRGDFEYHWGHLLARLQAMSRERRVLLLGVAKRVYRLLGPLRFRFSAPPAEPAAVDYLTLRTEKRMAEIDVAIRRYRAQAYSGSVTLMRTRKGRVLALGQPSLGWASVSRGEVEIIDVPGGHVSMLSEPHVRTVAEKLIQWL